VHIGPHMINSVIHRRGGPFFFALSLLPLFAMLWLLRRQEIKQQCHLGDQDAVGVDRVKRQQSSV